jgi:hypothetical protein
VLKTFMMGFAALDLRSIAATVDSALTGAAAFAIADNASARDPSRFLGLCKFSTAPC